MQKFTLVILTFLALYNPKVMAANAQITVHPMESADLAVDQIIIKKRSVISNIDENLKSYTELVGLFKQFQAYNISLSTKLLEKIQSNRTFSGDDLYLIKRTFEMFFKLHLKMLEFSNAHELKTMMMSKTLIEAENSLPELKSHLIWLSSNVLVMDHLESIHKILYLSDTQFRRIFKNSLDVDAFSPQDKTTIRELTIQAKRLTEILESTKFAQQIILFRSTNNWLKNLLKDNNDALVLLNEIQTNRIASEIARGRKNFELEIFALGDAFMEYINQITNFLSGAFGNIAGSMKWRKGYLYNDPLALTLTENSLRPMDILLEKSPFTLTDKLIPGHYGHAAIYLGTKAQLLNLGMWNHPSIIPHHASIEAGKTILEAVRPIVRLNSLKEFLNIDEITVIRKTDGLSSPVQIAEQITRGIEQLGKAYDFNFDISTLDKIVCSELIYIVFGNVNWPTHYRLGRPTFTPDDIGEVLFQKNTRFKITNYLLSTERQKIEKLDINNLAAIYDYELRSATGGPVKDPADASNSFWKKQTKCYNVAVNATNALTKHCKVSYKEYNYEEELGN